MSTWIGLCFSDSPEREASSDITVKRGYVEGLRDTCTRDAPREFSFHGRWDNPSLCHFSSVFLSPRLIELLGTRPRIPVTVPSYFFPPDLPPGPRERKHRFQRYSTPPARTKLDFVILPPVKCDGVPVAPPPSTDTSSRDICAYIHINTVIVVV